MASRGITMSLVLMLVVKEEVVLVSVFEPISFHLVYHVDDLVDVYVLSNH